MKRKIRLQLLLNNKPFAEAAILAPRNTWITTHK